MAKLISYIIPAYNEADNIPALYSGLINVLSRLDYDYEIIFINDGSADNSQQELTKIATGDSKVKVIEFSRNFGKEIALTAGLQNCQGDACLMLDADLQHPLELIPEFIKKWENGIEVVIGVRKANQSASLTKKLGSFAFYQIMKKIADTSLVPGATDFRLLDKKVIKEFNRFTEKNRLTRGLIAWMGFKRDYIYFTALPRQNGLPGYSLFKLIRLAMNSMVSLSLFPLKIAGYLGVFITVVSGFLGLFIVIEKYVFNDFLQLYLSGSAILAVIILFLVGIILCCLGLIALYIANIHGEVINRPLYVIRNKENF
jgi:polyisoprenyl-phosphate glycosyltransferase